MYRLLLLMRQCGHHFLTLAHVTLEGNREEMLLTSYEAVFSYISLLPTSPLGCTDVATLAASTWDTLSFLFSFWLIILCAALSSCRLGLSRLGVLTAALGWRAEVSSAQKVFPQEHCLSVLCIAFVRTGRKQAVDNHKTQWAAGDQVHGRKVYYLPAVTTLGVC